MHSEAYEFVRQQVSKRGPFLRVLEFGSRNVNGSVRELFTPTSFGKNYIGVDSREGPGVDVVADAATYENPVPFDCVVSTEVFEHTENWREIVANAFEHLVPGGVLIATTAAPGRAPHSAVDGSLVLQPGEFYANIDPGELWNVCSIWSDEVDVQLGRGGIDVWVAAVKRGGPAGGQSPRTNS